jgi:hypothetical protein
MPLPFIALYKDTIDLCVVLATQRDRQRGASEKSLDFRVGEGANSAGRWNSRPSCAGGIVSADLPADCRCGGRCILRSAGGLPSHNGRSVAIWPFRQSLHSLIDQR